MLQTSIMIGLRALTCVFVIFASVEGGVLRTNGPPSEIRRHYGFVPAPNAGGMTSASATAQYFTQKVDHSDSSNSKTFKQRWYSNDKWYKPGGPNFIMLGGNSAIDATWVENEALPWLLVAKEAQARVFLLEHRFYGTSQPTGDLEVASLKFLTSQQALADVNAFITAKNTELNLTNPKWVTFGGSYAGSLSAWARLKYPDTVYGAVASSAPVKAVVDFSEYLDVVYNALHSFNPKCADSVNAGFKKINELIKTKDGRGQLTANFDLCSDLQDADDNSVHYFYKNILDNYMSIVQYGNDNIDSYNGTLTISNLCAHQLQTPGNDFMGVVSVTDWLIVYYGEPCIDINYKGYLDFFKTAKVSTMAGDFRSWLWQTCNEFGFFESTDSNLTTNNFVGPDIPVDYYIQQCVAVFGDAFSNATIYSNIAKTNAYYTSQNYNSTRVVAPNGSNDPWHVLGIRQNHNPQLYAFTIAGAGHCADMYPSAPSDVPGLTFVKNEIRYLVLEWIYDTKF